MVPNLGRIEEKDGKTSFANNNIFYVGSGNFVGVSHFNPFQNFILLLRYLFPVIFVIYFVSIIMHFMKYLFRTFSIKGPYDSDHPYNILLESPDI